MPENKTEETTLDSLLEKYGKLEDATLVGVDGNAFSIMGHFRKNARRQGWSAEDIQFVIDKYQSGDYDNVIATIMRFTD